VAVLVFLSGNDAGRRAPLEARRLVYSLGSGANAGTDIVITDVGVDPTHALVERVGAELWLQCVAGPTWLDHVEQAPGARVRLKMGDRVTVGPVSLQLCSDSDAVALSERQLEVRGSRGRLDPLTLLQRPAVFWAGLDVVAEAGAKCSVSLIDLDHWKRLNDQEGMAAGDRALQWAALQLEKQALPQEVLGRVGGTRFALRMRELGPSAAFERTLMMLEALMARPYLLGGKPWAVTASAGCATLGLDGATPADVVRCAEARLDQAKAQGRARAVGRADGQRFDKPPNAS
jgi:diguanylate cyclase (GGDEF)-like protein